MSKVDLHLHSTASDGQFSPTEIVRKSAMAGLNVIALADHDTVNGIIPALEAVKFFPELEVLPCVEISTDISQGEVHILGYFVDYTNDKLQATLGKMRESRQERAQRMIIKLTKLGLSITWERVQEIAGSGSIGRPHIAQAMLERGYITSIKEAFTKYIGWGGPAYAEREKMSSLEAIELVLQAQGLPVFAHPLTIDNPEAIVIELKVAGLVGIEAYYGSYTVEEINRLVNIANRHNLIATGGSDYHGLEARNETMIGGADVPIESVEQLKTLAEQQALKLARL